MSGLVRRIAGRSAVAALGLSLIGAAPPAPAGAPPASAVAGVVPAPALTPPTGAGSAPNTTGPLNKPMIASIGTGVWFINEFGADSIYVVVGDRRALVIDTGSGFFDLKALVETLTKLPYDVVVTHGHPDHAGGIGQFDTVHIGAADIQAARNVSYEGRVRYGQIMRGTAIGSLNAWAYTDADVRKWDKTPEFKPIADGQVFDLGGRKITAYAMPNHTPGSTVFIDDKSRILFTGDAANFNVGANGTVSTALRGLLRLRDLRKDYDRTFWGHIGYAGGVGPIEPQPEQVLDDLIEAYRSILRGNPTVERFTNNLNPNAVGQRAAYGTARVTWNPDRLWEPGEAQVVP
jgi:hydroxyacylglutathione hydrolase